MNISESLLEWYYVNHRKLPWRETSDPYAIWLSEVMLQQTQVDTVIGYYNRFLTQLPTVNDLAEATEEQVYKLWEGLGYYSRAKNLMRCARIIKERYNGIFPRDYKTLIGLPGIGPYTVGAVLSIAYNLAYPAVDGNVMRVISRIYCLTEDISQPKSRQIFEKKVMEIIPEDARHFNQALMELGATLCTPKNPKCHQCPVAKHCEAKKSNKWAELPVKTKKINKTIKKIAAVWLKDDDKILIIKKSDAGLLSGLWGFPYVEYEPGQNPIPLIAQKMYKEYGFIVEHIGIKCESNHVFTHIQWDMTLYEFILFKEEKTELVAEGSDLTNFNRTWITHKEIKEYPMSTAFKKLIRNERH